MPEAEVLTWARMVRQTIKTPTDDIDEAIKVALATLIEEGVVTVAPYNREDILAEVSKDMRTKTSRRSTLSTKLGNTNLAG